MALSASVQQILRNTFSCTIAWQHWALEKRILTQWWKEVKLDYPWDLKTRIWEFQWRLKYKEAVRRRILWRIDWEQDSERNTLTRGTCGHKNEFKTETSVSRRCLQRRSVRRCWNEASLCFNTTTLQVCRIGILLTMDPTLHYKMTVTRRWWIWWRGCRPGDTRTETDSFQRRSWTSRRMCKLSETNERWTSLSTSHDERIMTALARSKAMASSNAKFCEHQLTPNLARTFRPMSAARADAFSGPSSCCTRIDALKLFGQETVSRRASSVLLFNVSSAWAHESRIKECNLRERRSVEILHYCQQCTTVHDVH